MQAANFKITKISDGDFVRRIRDALSQLGQQVTEVTGNAFAADLNAQDIQPVLELDSFACTRLKVALNSGESIQLTRPEQQQTPQLFDTVTVNPQPGSNDVVGFAKLNECVRKALPDADSLSYLEFLKESDRQMFVSREQEIHELKRIQIEFFDKFQAFALDQEARRQKFEEVQEKRLASQLAEIETQRQSEQESLARKHAEFDERQKKFDSRDATHVRRELRQQLQEEIQKRSTQFNLTRDTLWRRRQVMASYFVFLVCLGCLVAYSVVYSPRVAIAPDGNSVPQANDSVIYVTMTDYLLSVGRQTAILIAFVVAFAFFIRWQHDWFSRHADEEFKAKRLALDVDRASWVFETALSWKEDKDSPVPQYLIEQLGRNLFVDELPADHPITAADALLGSSAGLKFKLAGNEFSIERETGGKKKRES